MSKEVNPDYPGNKQRLSDEELKNQVIRDAAPEVKKQAQSERKFPTEIIPLPSKGMLYPKDSPLSEGNIEIKYMTAKEEDILTSQNLIKNGTVIDVLLRNLIVSPINYNDLLVGDKNAVMIAARVLAYGKQYDVELQNPSTGEKQKEVIDLTQFEAKEFDESLSKLEQWIVLTKADTKTESKDDYLSKAKKIYNNEVFLISSITGEGLSELVKKVSTKIIEINSNE